MLLLRSKIVTLSITLVLTLSGLFLIKTPAFADCPSGWNNNMSVNATTGELVYYCTPVGDNSGRDYNPQTNPDAPPADRTLTREQVDAENATRVAAERAAAAIRQAAQDIIDAAAREAALAAPANPLDPIPELLNGDKIPGTTISGQGDFTCPAGSSKALEMNATTHQETSYCVKNWVAPDVQQAIDDERAALRNLQLQAENESRAWNEAHPGEQKCVTYALGNSSGGVCANVVGTRADGTTGQVASSAVGATGFDSETAKVIVDSGTARATLGFEASQQILRNSNGETTTAGNDMQVANAPIETNTSIGDSQAPSGSVDVSSISGKTTVLKIDSDSPNIHISLIASKKGFKPITKDVLTNSQGDRTIKFSLNLKGYTIQISVDGEMLDKIKI